MGLLPLDDSTPFREAFSRFKSNEYELQKNLVNAVRLEDSNRASSLETELRASPPKCSNQVRAQLEKSRGKFVGQCFYHKHYGYRGVIFKPDHTCRMDQNWIDSSGLDTLPRGLDQPFYHCLVDMRDRPGGQTTYVAEENIEASHEAFSVQHPLLGSLFVEVPQLRCYVGTEGLERVLHEYPD